MTASVALPVGAAHQNVDCPQRCSRSTGPSSVVFILSDDGAATSVPVTLGQAAGAWVSIQGDVKPGDKVIVRGNERIFPVRRSKGNPGV